MADIVVWTAALAASKNEVASVALCEAPFTDVVVRSTATNALRVAVVDSWTFKKLYNRHAENTVNNVLHMAIVLWAILIFLFFNCVFNR